MGSHRLCLLFLPVSGSTNELANQCKCVEVQTALAEVSPMHHTQEDRNGLTDFRTLPQSSWVRFKTPWALPTFGNKLETSVRRRVVSSLLACLQKKWPERYQCICATDRTNFIRAYLLERCPELSLVKGSETVKYKVGSYLWV